MRLTVIHKTYTAYFKSKVSFRKSWVALKRAVGLRVIKPSCLQAPAADNLLFYLSRLSYQAPSSKACLLSLIKLPLLASRLESIQDVFGLDSPKQTTAHRCILHLHLVIHIKVYG